MPLTRADHAPRCSSSTKYFGFRCSPRAQQFYGVTPDLTTLAKIIAGGYPEPRWWTRRYLERARVSSGRRNHPAECGASGHIQRGARFAAAGIAT